MTDKFLYLIAEGFRSLWRAKLSAFASITAIGVAMSLVGFGAILGESFSNLIHIARSQYKLEVFFHPLITDSEASSVVVEIGKIPGVRSATLVTKQEAAEIFERQFGENIFELLEENPLPSSCAVTLIQEGRQPLDVSPIVSRMQALGHVDEVRYQGGVISTIERYYEGFFALITGLAVIVLIGTVILISNTIRLTIYSRKDLIETLRLVGATNRFIRFPFLVEGVIEGVLGALLAGAVTYGFVRGANYFLSLFTKQRLAWDIRIVALLVCVVVVFSVAGSGRAVRKFLR
ncbi:MAG: permease-like cell division protein FtsX [Candidatus Neomarinimicrobiota bacterium]